MFNWFIHRGGVTLSQEEARTAIKALRRSTEAMPEATETFRSRDMRAYREMRLAERIGTMIGAHEQ
jgi:hypothetical protein